MSQSTLRATSGHPEPTVIARFIRWMSVPIILGWLALIAVLSVTVPSLEQIGRDHAVPMSSEDAPSWQAMTRMGKVFGESDSDSNAMVEIGRAHV